MLISLTNYDFSSSEILELHLFPFLTIEAHYITSFTSFPNFRSKTIVTVASRINFKLRKKASILQILEL